MEKKEFLNVLGIQIQSTLGDKKENCKKVEWDLSNDEEKKVSSLFEMKKNGQKYVYALSSKTSYGTSEFYESYVLNDRDKTSIKRYNMI